MKINFTTAMALALGCIAIFCSCERIDPAGDRLEAGFREIPDSVQTAVYWYWVSDHISPEGIVKDLYAMKSAGINRAFIGNIGLGDNEVGVGKVKFDSEEWWEAMHTALKTATELDIEIGIFNSPGWSQSGGPWIKPEQAMRYLASNSVRVSGGKDIEVEIPRPRGVHSDHFEDVKLIAYPAITEAGHVLNSGNATVSVTPASKSDAANIIDGDLATQTEFSIPAEGDVVVDFHADSPFTLRGFKIYANTAPIDCPARIEARDGDVYRTLTRFHMARFNPAANVGWEPFAPVAISVPATTAQDFRLVISGVGSGSGLREVELSSVPFVESYSEKTLAKMYQNPLPYWHEYMWRDQPAVNDLSLVIDPSTVLDISDRITGDKVIWDAPEGDWVIMRTGMIPTGTQNAPARVEATGLEVDKMSREHTRSHFDAYMQKILDRIPAEDRRSWKMVVQDSYETGGQNFTDDFLDSFAQRYGYDPLPFLPVYDGVVVGSEDISDRFLWDMRRFVADRVAYDYVGGLREICNEHGLKTWLECYGHWGFPGEFLQYGGQSDEIGGEFWSVGTLGDIENRAASSCGHIYGKNRISAESFTSGDGAFHRAPSDYKQRGDRFFSEGINNTLLHLYIHQAYEDVDPGINAWFGNEFNRKNTWFPHFDLFVQYLKRTNYMLQQGLNVADVAYFVGEDAPKMTGVTDPALPAGYQFDYINAEVILRDAFVRDGMLTLPHGTSYRVLVLPKQQTMRPELLDKIGKLIKQGAIVLGPAPVRSPSYENYPHADAKVKETADALWSQIDPGVGYARIGKGILMDGIDMARALEIAACPPDCMIPADSPIMYGHRRMPGIDIYFISNQSDSEIIFAPEFRVKGMLPELWDATTGSIRKLPSFAVGDNGGTVVSLKLDKYESAFIVFRQKAVSIPSAVDITLNYPPTKTLMDINTPWTVTFQSERRGPVEPMIMDELQDLTQFEQFDVKHYSGLLWYRTEFTLDEIPPGRVFVNLGEFWSMAKVRINGKYAGGLWTPPYRLDITDYVIAGRNGIEIEISTTWKNRLIGDLNLPGPERLTWLTHQPWRADSSLQPSGLRGPVTIENIVY